MSAFGFLCFQSKIFYFCSLWHLLTRQMFSRTPLKLLHLKEKEMLCLLLILKKTPNHFGPHRSSIHEPSLVICLCHLILRYLYDSNFLRCILEKQKLPHFLPDLILTNSSFLECFVLHGVFHGILIILLSGLDGR